MDPYGLIRPLRDRSNNLQMEITGAVLCMMTRTIDLPCFRRTSSRLVHVSCVDPCLPIHSPYKL